MLMPVMAAKQRLGEILIEARVISEDQLEDALYLQQENHKLLGQILVEMNWATEQQVCQAVAKTLNLAYANVDHALISREIVQLLAESFATRQNVLPLFIQDKNVYLATEHALEHDLVRQIETHTGLRVKLLIAPPIQLQQAVHSHYALEPYMSLLLTHLTSEEPVLVEQPAVGSDTPDFSGEFLRFVKYLVAHATTHRASMISLTISSEHAFMQYMIDGVLTDDILLPTWLASRLLSTLKAIAGFQAAGRYTPQNGSFQVTYKQHTIDLLIANQFSECDEILNIRIRDPKTALSHVNRLGLSSDQQRLCRTILHQPQGWILVTGPAGCGATTTLYALLNAINGGRKTIATLENPVEYKLEGIEQFQVNPGVESAFNKALESLLSQHPDVMLIGEIRDTEVATLSAQAAASGTLVLSPLHTSDVVSAIYRLLSLGVSPDVLGSALLLVIAQRLVRRICPQCKTRHIPTDEEVHFLEMAGVQASGLSCHRGEGCATCNYTGYYGQTGIYEIFLPNERIRAKIGKQPPKQELRDLISETGMESLVADGVRKIRQGITTIEEVARVCPVPDEEADDTIQCPSCGEIALETDLICPSCQYRLSTPCEQCGAELEQRWNTCPFCGAQQQHRSDEISSLILQLVHETDQTSEPSHPIRIVVAESDNPTRSMVASILKRQGYDVFTAVHGEEALRMARLKHPALLILAHDLPKLNGFEVCNLLRSNIDTMFLPVLMLTKKNSLEEHLQGLACGVNHYLHTPFEPEDVLTHVDFILHQLYQR